jgi:hypothetical protein
MRVGCGKQFSERSAGVLNKAQNPSDIIALVVLWRLCYKLSLRRLLQELTPQECANYLTNAGYAAT